MAEQQTQPESQKQRWVKYGANVALTVIVAIVLAVLVIYLAQSNKRRVDTTAMGLYSLKPQTVNIIKDLKQKITLVSLYARPEVQDDSADYIQPVVDLLEEYKRKGNNIEVEIIDPIRNPTKVDNLIDTVARKYGGEVEKYKQYLDQYPAVFDQISKLGNDEAKKVESLPMQEVNSQDLYTTLLLTTATVQQFPAQLKKMQDRIDQRLKLKPPDYKGATESVSGSMEDLSSMLSEIIRSFGELKEDTKVPDPIRKYMTDNLANYELMKKLADAEVEKIKGLGELKLDDLRQSLRERDAILVMGEKDMRVIGRDKVWQVAPDRTMPGAPELKPRFAGEQQISTAILALTSEKKQKVVFLRPGGGPLTDPGFPPFQPSGPFSAIAQRLRDYNFDVLEKDLSGQYAMQAMQRGMPATPEPTDEEIKDAIWIVLGVPPPDPQQGMMMPPPNLSPKLKAHLDAGGSAMILTLPRADAMTEALAPWGITIKPDVIAVHQITEQTGSERAGDMIEEAQRIPFIFVIKQWGDHAITRPLQSLDGLLIPMVLVDTQAKDGFKTTPLLPIDANSQQPSWGESDMEAALQGKKVEFNAPASGGNDVPPPIYAGAAVERDAGGRLVVIGSLQFVMNDFLSIPDMEYARQGIPVARFPGNAELFTNSIFWLSKMETMIAISPAAMEVSRIAPMTDGTLSALRIGVLLVGLPLAVVIAGAVVYFARRD
jgi:hypothetical protein